MILGEQLIMISGIGVDIVEKNRFEKVINKFGDRISLKILSQNEHNEYLESKDKPSYLSKKFAAKEAFSKAFGSGLYRKGIYPKLITVNHNSFGKPFFSFAENLDSLFKNKFKNIQLSITDSDSQSIAFVIIEQ